jgi:hypothetical protein
MVKLLLFGKMNAIPGTARGGHSPVIPRGLGVYYLIRFPAPFIGKN